MDLKGSLVDTNLHIYPSENLLKYIKSLPLDKVPRNILKILGVNDNHKSFLNDETHLSPIQLNNEDFGNLDKIKKRHAKLQINHVDNKDDNDVIQTKNANTKPKEIENSEVTKKDEAYLISADINWLYVYLKKLRSEGKSNIPYLHELLEGSIIEMPDNKIIKRNPVLEARCVKLRAQQEAREYRKMTRSVDNVRMKFPEDSISYQLKHLNRQLIAIGQFLISIFAGFLFGFKGVEWTIGGLDFGFRLLLGVMCALVIALAEIYFLAKKLNEELSIPETVQLGGPVKFAEGTEHAKLNSPHEIIDKEHQD